MIEVRNLTKVYGKKKAVDDLSFTIEDGEIFGFLGPNGAGKSTTMNIITGCLSATEGTVVIDGNDIFEEAYKAKKNVGYLPEQPPLYMDMTVEEYLRFVAEAKKVKKDKLPEEVDRVMKKTSILDVHNRLIKTLSKGYKQRVGIAQALIGNPKVIILDEPTAGLDPTERVRFRNLISELSEDRIVILSTHIVSDVEYIANEIWLMKDGQIMQQGNLDQTLASMQEKVYACEVSQADATKMMKKFKVSNMKAESGMVNLRIIASEPPIAGASVVEPTLEDVFLYYFGEKGGEME